MPEAIHRYAELEIGLHGTQTEDSYQVEISFTDPSHPQANAQEEIAVALSGGLGLGGGLRLA